MALLRKFVARSWPDKVLLVRALSLVISVRVGLWVLPYRTVCRLVSHPLALSGERLTIREEALRQRRIVGAVESISRRLLGNKPCLTQALVAQRLLRQEGFETALRIGVAKEGRELLAHAWLEREGRVLIGGGHSPALYAPLTPVQPEAS